MSTANKGLRESKRSDTYSRIAEVGMRLFIEHGYAATTLEMVAEASGIARRTFFSYFESKDAILLEWERTGWRDLLDEMRKASPDGVPLIVVRDTMLRVISRKDESRLRAIVKVMGCRASLLAVRHGSFAEREATLYAALRDLWPQQERAASLRLVAMVSVGALRVAFEAWEVPDNQAAMTELLQQAFATLDTLLAAA